MKNHNNDSKAGTDVEIKEPIVVVGIGGAGSRLAVTSSKLLGCKCVLISNNKKDLHHNCLSIFIDSNSWVNPSSYKIRSFAQSSAFTIKSALNDFKTVIVIANLAGRAGTAIAPLVCKEAKLSTQNTTIISFAIMPFRFEKDRIFQAGVSLNRLRDISDATIIIDNDALLDNNPELSCEDCYKITNAAFCEVISGVCNGYVYRNMNLLCTGNIGSTGAESSIKDSLAMLYQNADPVSIKRAIVHVMGGEKVPIGILDSIASNLQAILNNERIAEVSMCMSSSDNVRVHLMASVGGKTRFDKYDPIAEIIPKQNVLDWDEMDSSPDIELQIPNLE